MSRRSQNRGFTLIESLIALACFAIVMVIGVTVISSAGHGFAREATTIRSQTTLDRLADQMTASAHTSVSVFTPTSCGGAGAGDGQACSQIRFDGVDSSGATHIWGWEFAAGVLKECLSYPDADDGCTKYGASTNISTFSATPTSITSLPITTTLGYVPTLKENEVGIVASDPNGRVVAGNRVMVIQYADANVQREVHLLQGGTPFTAAVLKGAFTPPNLGNLTTGLQPSNAFFFQSTTTGCYAASYGVGSVASPCQVTATEANYSQYEPYISAPYWSASSCTNANGTVATVAQTAGGGDSTTWQMTPVAAGTCSFSISTHDQSVSVSVTIYAIPEYTLSLGAVSSANILDTQTDTISASANQNAPPALATYPPGTPASANVEIASLTGNVTNDTLGWQASGTTFTMTGNSYSTGNGMIAANPPVSNAVIVNNNQTFSFNIWDPPVYDVSVSTNSLTVQVGTTATWTGGSNIQNPVQSGVAEGIAPATLSVAYTNKTGSCTWPTGSWMTTTATFQAIPTAGGICTVDVTDTNNDAPQLVTINGTWPALSPGSPNAIANGPTSIALNSSPPSGGSGSGYYVTYTIIGGPSNPGLCSGSYACTSTPLLSGSTYTYSTMYYDGAGNSVAGPSVSATTPWPGFNPGAPGCNGDSATTITCDSSPPSGGTGTGFYVVYYITGGPDHGGATCGAAVYACQYTGLTASSTYGITAEYYDSAGHNASAPASASTQASPNQFPGYEYFVYSMSADERGQNNNFGLFGTYGYLYLNGVLEKTNAIDGNTALCEGPLTGDMDFPPTVDITLIPRAQLTSLAVTPSEVATLYESEGVPAQLAEAAATCSLTTINALIPVGLEELEPGTGPFLNTDVYQLTTYDIGTLP